MSFNSNPLLKLDILEYHLNQSKQVRFPKTRDLYRSKSIQLKLIPSISDFPAEIQKLQTTIFNNKHHSGEVKLVRVLKRVLKGLKKLNEEQEKFVKTADVTKIAQSRLLKIVQTNFKINVKQAAKNDKVKYIPEEIMQGIMSRDQELNPSTFYNSLGDAGRVVMSKVWSNKEILKTVEEIEGSFKVLFGKVSKDKDGKKENEKEQANESVSESESESEPESESESESESQSDSEDADDESGEDEEDQDLDMEAYSEFDRFLVASDDEENAPSFFDADNLDDNINYNEVTDEEPSEESEAEEDGAGYSSDEPVTKKAKKEKKESKKDSKKDNKDLDDKKHKLPALAFDAGYISGESDHDISEDEVVKKVTTERKNRPGQRARQKLWEKKFGRNAKHITKEKNEYFQEQKERMYAFEERKAKRQAKLDKAKKMGVLGDSASAANLTPLVPKAIREKVQSGNVDKLTSKEIDVLVAKSDKLHPSWEAKNKLKEQASAKFEGKKIKF